LLYIYIYIYIYIYKYIWFNSSHCVPEVAAEGISQLMPFTIFATFFLTEQRRITIYSFSSSLTHYVHALINLISVNFSSILEMSGQLHALAALPRGQNPDNHCRWGYTSTPLVPSWRRE
jgi:hypothetical protein